MTLEQYTTYQEGCAERDKKIDWFLWMMGRYTADAIASVMSDRKHRYRYPEKPYLEQADDRIILDGSGLSEEEKAAERMKLMRQMGYDPDAFETGE